MERVESLSHSVWECKYHVALSPSAVAKRCMCNCGLPLAKYAVSEVVGFIKGKSAIHLSRTYGERKQKFTGQHFWARGYFMSTVGRDEAQIREYIRNQEVEDKRLDQLQMWN